MFPVQLYALDMQPQNVPRQHCSCGWHGVSTTGQRGSAVERADVEAAHRSWARHALTCTKGAGMRGIVHDRIVDIVMVLLENAGFDKVKTEDLWWDAEAAYSDADHRRPDVTCVHPVTGEKLVFDVVVWWGASKGFREDGGAVAASQREAWKRRRYERAMWARYVEQLSPEDAVAWADDEANVMPTELDWSQVPQTHRFVPLGFEAGGAFGQATLDFLKEVDEVAGDQSSADLFHWSAMEFGEHWLQRLSLVLARGQGDLVLEAVKTARKNHRGRDGGRGASAEWSQTDCQPCVSLV